jgi:hypothetical protein
MSLRPKVAWPRVINDMTNLGLTVDDFVERLGIRPALLARIAAGDVPPKPLIADRIIGLWIHLTGNPERFIHVQAEPAGAEPVQLDQKSGCEARAASSALLRAVVAQWAAASRKHSGGHRPGGGVAYRTRAAKWWLERSWAPIPLDGDLGGFTAHRREDIELGRLVITDGQQPSAPVATTDVLVCAETRLWPLACFQHGHGPG